MIFELGGLLGEGQGACRAHRPVSEREMGLDDLVVVALFKMQESRTMDQGTARSMGTSYTCLVLDL